MVLSPNDEEVTNSSKKKQPNSRLECTNLTLFQTKMVEIDTLFQTKTVKKHTLWCGTFLFSLYKGLPFPPGAKIMSLAAYASETNQAFFDYKNAHFKKSDNRKEISSNTSLVELSSMII